MLGRKSRKRYGKCPHMHFSTVWKFHKIIKSLTLYRKGIINWNELIAFSLMWFNQWKPQFWHIGCLEFERKSRGIQTFCWENFKKSHRYILLFLQDDWSLLSLLSLLSSPQNTPPRRQFLEDRDNVWIAYWCISEPST